MVWNNGPLCLYDIQLLIHDDLRTFPPRLPDRKAQENVLRDKWYDSSRCDVNEGMRWHELREKDQSSQQQQYRKHLDKFLGKQRSDAVDGDHDTAQSESHFVDIAPFAQWLNPDHFDFDKAISQGATDMQSLVTLVNSWMHHKKADNNDDDDSKRSWTAKHLAEANLLSPAGRCVIRSHYNFPASTTKGSRPQVLNAYLPSMFELAYADYINNVLLELPSHRQLRKALECVLDQYTQPNLDQMFGRRKGGWRWLDTDRRIRDEDENAMDIHSSGLITETRWKLAKSEHVLTKEGEVWRHFKALLEHSTATALNPVTGKMVTRSISKTVAMTLNAGYKVSENSST